MINTFKPYITFWKRTRNTNDWFNINLHLCNELQLTVTIYGYGLSIGVWLFDVLKRLEEEE